MSCLPCSLTLRQLRAGLDTPCGSAAIGWRIAVYERTSAAFSNADVAAYNPATGRHLVVCDDGAEETLDLGSEVVRWVLPLNTVTGGAAAAPALYPAAAAEHAGPQGAWSPVGGRLPAVGWLQDYGGAPPAPAWANVEFSPAGAAAWWQAPRAMVPARVGVLPTGGRRGPRCARRLAVLDQRGSVPTRLGTPPSLGLPDLSAGVAERAYGSAPDLTAPAAHALGLRFGLPRTTSAPSGPAGLEAQLLADLGGDVPPAHDPNPMSPRSPFGFAEDKALGAEDLLLVGGTRMGGLPDDDPTGDVEGFLCGGGPEEDPLVAACAIKDPPRTLIALGSADGIEVSNLFFCFWCHDGQARRGVYGLVKVLDVVTFSVLLRAWSSKLSCPCARTCDAGPLAVSPGGSLAGREGPASRQQHAIAQAYVQRFAAGWVTGALAGHGLRGVAADRRHAGDRRAAAAARRGNARARRRLTLWHAAERRAPPCAALAGSAKRHGRGGGRGAAGGCGGPSGAAAARQHAAGHAAGTAGGDGGAAAAGGDPCRAGVPGLVRRGWTIFCLPGFKAVAGSPRWHGAGAVMLSHDSASGLPTYTRS